MTGSQKGADRSGPAGAGSLKRTVEWCLQVRPAPRRRISFVLPACFEKEVLRHSSRLSVLLCQRVRGFIIVAVFVSVSLSLSFPFREEVFFPSFRGPLLEIPYLFLRFKQIRG